MRRLGIAWGLIAAGCAGAPGLRTGETRVIVHRGGLPDGTVAGCLGSIAKGRRFLELDVRLTKDGRAVVLHDPTVDRTTDGRGPVAELSFEELCRLDAGGGERVPEVAELLRAVGNRAVVLLELKVPEAAEAVAAAIRETGAFHRAVVRSADRALLRRLRAAEPRLLLGTMGADLEGLDGIDAFTPLRNELLTREAVARLHAKGVAAWGTNTNDETVMRNLVEAGVDGVITDRPELLEAVRR
jgi:glycerophosphoryl diester phosphodiesterase